MPKLTKEQEYLRNAIYIMLFLWLCYLIYNKSSLTGVQTGALLVSQLGALSPTQISYFTPTQISGLTTDQLSGIYANAGDKIGGGKMAFINQLSTTQILSVTKATLTAKTSAALFAITQFSLINALLNADIIVTGDLSSAQVGGTLGSMTTAEVQMLTSQEIASIDPTSVLVVIPMMTTAQVMVLLSLQTATDAAIMAMYVSQIQAIPTVMLSPSSDTTKSFTNLQWSAWKQPQIQALSVSSQIPSITSLVNIPYQQVNMFSVAQIQALKPATMASLSQDQIAK